AVITDYGDCNDIHPKQKKPVGERLGLLARGIAYGEKIVYSGPVYKSMKIDGSRVVLNFDWAKGLNAKGGELKGFTIAGEDGKFVPAKAEIVGEKVVVFSPDVSKPTAVRYGWSDCPDVNLYNGAGLPASPFRTDN
ncbi:MAG: 9-O-acetylesterase, partial [Armatimonadota bacterium]|nr:9-O-acetylesterase [Armatimonadota bacterium]